MLGRHLLQIDKRIWMVSAEHMCAVLAMLFLLNFCDIVTLYGAGTKRFVNIIISFQYY